MDLHNKSNRKLFLLIKKLRKQQRIYSKFKEKKAFNESQKLEKELDKMLLAIEKLPKNEGLQFQDKEAQPPKNLF